jgi:hypothetical protein
MIFLLASTLSLFLQAPPEAQVSDPPAPAASEQPMGTPRVAASSPSKPMRPPLLREGSFLTAARGTIGYDESIGAWTFKSVRDSGNGDDRTFGVLPTQALQDMLRTMQDRDASISFEVTGRILVYDGMNFILPTVGTPITAPEPVTSPVEPDEADQGTSDAPKNTLDDGGGDVADRLEARLRERIGALPVSSDLGVQSTETAYARTLKEGTRLQNRRGSIVRDQRSGTWRFVFDSHGGPAVDPSMELLPCLLLERTAAVSDLPPSVLISGEVTSFHGRNYMLPTIWRSARPGRNLIP